MNSVSGDPVFSVPNAIGSGGSTVDLSNYPDLEDATLTQANTIPVFETSGQKRLKLTTYEAGDFDARITTNTQDISAAQSNVDVLTTNFNTHAASQEFHANVGKSGQGINAVALGSSAAQSGQGRDSVAVGARAGENTQGVQAVAVGSVAGKDGQGQDAIAIGYSAASQGQGAYAVAIGSVAANTSQGDYAIAIGRAAVAANQAANSIAVNASNNAITANQAGLFVAPIRDTGSFLGNGQKVLGYDGATKEVVLRTVVENTAVMRRVWAPTTQLLPLLTYADTTFILEGNGINQLKVENTSTTNTITGISYSVVIRTHDGTVIDQVTNNNQSLPPSSQYYLTPWGTGPATSSFNLTTNNREVEIWYGTDTLRWRIFFHYRGSVICIKVEFYP